MITIDRDGSDSIIDSNEQLKEQLALSKKEIRNLKRELEEEKERSFKQKEYYEDIIRDYRKIANDAVDKAETYKTEHENMMNAVGNLIKMLAGE